MANPQQFSTGSTHVFLNVGNGVQYFGTAESFPQDSRSPQYEFLMNDLSGSKVPLDLAYEGESAQISMVMTRWDGDLANSATISVTGNAAGEYFWEDLGTLMMLENEATELWIVYLYGSALANKTVYTANGLIPGRHYKQTVLWAPQTDETGSKPEKRHFMYYAWPKIDSANQKFVLWDTDMTGINLGLIK